jgi:hypothetical protein
MAGQREESLSHTIAAPEEQLLIEEASVGLATLAAPPPRWIGRVHRRRPRDAAAERQSREAPEREKKGLI